jgi:hypothetical protein
MSGTMGWAITAVATAMCKFLIYSYVQVPQMGCRQRSSADRKQKIIALIGMLGLVNSRPRIIVESQPVKNRNLSRLLANLSRLNWSSQGTCVYCFFISVYSFQKQQVPSEAQTMLSRRPAASQWTGY